jgi:hypothetical protein
MAVRLEPATSAPGDFEATPSEREGGETGDLGWTRIKRQWPAAVCCVVYLVLAMATYGHVDSLGPGHMAGYGTNDTIVQIWWLAWAAHAMPQVHNLLFTQGQNYPFGQNFGVNGSMLALGFVFTPITKLFGPVVTWNLLVRLALAASALSMCLVLRRWTTWWPAAFLGGLLYGFSAYNMHLGLYPFLTFVPLPPIIFLLLDEILVRQRWRPGRTGVLLGLVCVVQFFISTEVLAGTVVMGAIAVAFFLLIYRRTLRERWRYAGTAFAYSVGVAGLLLVYPVWVTFDGPQHINGPPQTAAFWAAFLPVDLLSVIVPEGQWIQPSHFAPAVQHLFNGGLVYLGLPLVVVLLCFAVFFRKRGTILFAGAMALVAFVLSLGPRLLINGRITQTTLPFELFEHIPALNGFQTGRFALYTDLFAAGMFAIGMDQLWKWLRQSRHLVRLSPQWSMASRAVVLGAVAVIVILPLVPGGTQPTTPTDVPSFFTSAAVDSIPPGSAVLAYPYSDGISNELSQFTGGVGASAVHSAMLDQAVAGMPYNLIGGFGWFPSPTGLDGTTTPALLEPQSVQTLFDVAVAGGANPAQRQVLSHSNLTTDLRTFLRKYNVQTILVDNRVLFTWRNRSYPIGNPASVIRHVTAAIGPPVVTGGVSAWFNVRQRVAAHTR